MALDVAGARGAGESDDDGVGLGDAEALGRVLGPTEPNGDTDGIGVTGAVVNTGCGGAFATVLERPPKKCPRIPPNKRPAKTTMRTSGKSGKPPPPPESSSERRRRGTSLT
jgi:hypothetical protein